jgi:flagellar basal-body rod modification protein FlgD
MDVAKAQSGVGLQTLTGNEDRDQAKKNALNSLQAKYGDKPKEPRPIKKQLDKDDFMRIMISEMKHQDPTKPMDADKMATQMAQLTTVEQIKNMSASIDRLGDKNGASDRLAMSSMIGKTVTVDKSRFNHTKGTIAPINFELPEASQKVKLSVLDERGEEVITKELEPQPAGLNIYNWDGINSSGVQVKSGNYTVRVDAEGVTGNKLKNNPISKETIVGVSFENGETNFLVGDAKNPQRVGFKNVIKIEGDSQASGATSRTPAKAQQLSPELEAQMKKDRDAVANAPGIEAGKPVAENAMPADLASAMSGMKAALGANGGTVVADGVPAAPANESPETAVKPEGFANGLQE